MHLSSKKITFVRILSLCILAVLLFLNYGLARNAIDSLFLSKLSSTKLPIAWLLTGIAAAIIMAIYNKYNIRHSLLKLFSISSYLCGLTLAVLLIGLYLEIPYMPYGLYVWKEVHIVLLVEIFWSFSDIVFSIKTAKWLYGLLMLMGSIGAIIGSLIIGPLATTIGTIASLWCLLPIFFLCYLTSLIAEYLAGDKVPNENKKKHSCFGDSLILVRNSKYLLPLLCIVLLTQMSMTLIDYEYNTFMQNTYTNLDIRTGMMGKIHAILDCLSILFQLSCGLIFRIFGVGGAIIGIPLIVGVLSSLFLAIPNITFIISVRIGAKSLDYSIFKAAKEILYIPLTRDEKTQGKALIDIMIYRTGKALSSLILIGMLAIEFGTYAMPLAFLFQIIWLFLAFIIAKRQKELH